jgi:hypothetical protein
MGVAKAIRLARLQGRMRQDKPLTLGAGSLQGLTIGSFLHR